MPVAPPRPKGPPRNALRAFEAAARLGGFSAAAEELLVTPGAVAFQVKTLEEWAGAPLFIRHPQGVRLTALGREAAQAFGTAFDVMGAATHSLRAGASPDTVRIATLPGVAQLWLSPRLPAIRAETGGILSVSALEAAPNLNRAQFDIAIFMEPSAGAAEQIDLGPDEIFPVCAPALAPQIAREGLRGATLLTDAAWAGDWALWSGTTPPDGPVFSLYSMAVAETVAGAGVLIGHEHLVRAHLDNGMLSAPFEKRVPTGNRLTLSLATGAGPQAIAVARHLARGFMATTPPDSRGP